MRILNPSEVDAVNGAAGWFLFGFAFGYVGGKMLDGIWGAQYDGVQMSQLNVP